MLSLSPARLVTACVLAVTCYITPAYAASDYLLELDGVKGESKLQPGAIDIVAFSHDVKSPRDSSSGLATGRRQHSPVFGGGGGGGGGTTGDVIVERENLSDISFSCPQGAVAGQLQKMCAQGQHIKETKLTCRKSGERDSYLKIEMKDLLISSYSSTGNSSDDAPNETFSLSCSEVTFVYATGGDPSELRVKFIVKK